MRGRRLCIRGMLALVVMPAVCAAQEKPTTGLTVATPTAVGILWHMTDRVAVRPEFAFTTSEVLRDADIVESNASNYIVNVSGLFYVQQWGDLRTYVAPRFSYSHSSTELNLPSGSTTKGIGNTYGFAGSFGAEYAIDRRFAVFGETGLGFARQTSRTEPAVVITERKINMTSVRTALGIVLYF